MIRETVTPAWTICRCVPSPGSKRKSSPSHRSMYPFWLRVRVGDLRGGAEDQLTHEVQCATPWRQRDRTPACCPAVWRPLRAKQTVPRPCWERTKSCDQPETTVAGEAYPRNPAERTINDDSGTSHGRQLCNSRYCPPAGLRRRHRPLRSSTCRNPPTAGRSPARRAATGPRSTAEALRRGRRWKALSPSRPAAARDCHFCSQSGLFDSPVRGVWLDIPELVKAAKETAATGATEFCIVAAVRGPDIKLMNQIEFAIDRINEEVEINIACSWAC